MQYGMDEAVADKLRRICAEEPIENNTWWEIFHTYQQALYHGYIEHFYCILFLIVFLLLVTDLWWVWNPPGVWMFIQIPQVAVDR